MKLHQLQRKQIVAADLDETWDFFSKPENLKKITPPYMGFDIQQGGKGEMHPGMIIAYKVRPLFNLPLIWVTEITHVVKRRLFVDEQRLGPYKFWHHQHHFKNHSQGVEMTDIVSYALPFDLFGLGHQLLVKQKLRDIFEFRERKVEDVFGRI